MFKWKFEMPYLPDLQSVGGNARHAHWSGKAKAMKAEKDLWISAIRYQHMPPMPRFLRPDIKITMVFPAPRDRDRDNLMTALKSFFDALRCWLIITDDSPRFLGAVELVELVDGARAPLTVVELEGELAEL